jgi:protease II
VLIDVDAQAQGKTFYKVIAGQHSPDHSLFAYAVDEQGSEIYTVYVKDLATGQTLENRTSAIAPVISAGHQTRATYLLDFPRQQRSPRENLSSSGARRRRHACL